AAAGDPCPGHRRRVARPAVGRYGGYPARPRAARERDDRPSAGRRAGRQAGRRDRQDRLDPWDAHVAAVADAAVCPVLTLDAARWREHAADLDEPLHVIEIADP